MPSAQQAIGAYGSKINQMIGRFDDGQQVHFLEIGQSFLEPAGSISKDIMPELLHLSTTGYERWAQALEPKLKELGL